MKKTKATENSYSAKEVLNFIQSAVLGASRSAKLPKLTDGNLRRLRTYTEALIQPLREHTEDEEARFSSQELVLVLLTAAQIIQLLDVMGLEKSPFEIEGLL